MPYKYVYVPPEVFLEHEGIIVYHCYKDGDFERILRYWYTLDPEEEPNNEFDIRDLSNYNEEQTHKEIIMKAIENKEIKLEEQ